MMSLTSMTFNPGYFLVLDGLDLNTFILAHSSPKISD